MLRRIAMVAVTATWFISALGADNSSRAHPIYRCATVHGMTFSDRPCGPGSELYEPDLSAVSVVEVVTPPATSSPATSPRPVGAAASAQGPSKAQTCERLEQSLRQIASKMRAGYRAKEGERLKERKRGLQEKRRSQRC